jgi:alpha-tubulin suppressor-like RCC1 family protein
LIVLIVRAWFLALPIVLLGCSPGAFVCEASDQCGVGGRCEPSGRCSFADATCEDGRRYGEYAGNLADLCVGDAPMPGATRAVAFALGADHGCAIDERGDVRCWGRNDQGALGDGTRTHRSTPVEVRGLPPITWLAAGELHTCAIDDDGAVWCWGGGDYGQLGDGQASDRDEPAKIEGLTGAIAIAVGEHHSCAVVTQDESGGRVYCWGAGKYGQLGNGDKRDRDTPTAVDIFDAESLIADGNDTCARRSGGTVSCWGKNEHGQFGVGDMRDRNLPLDVPWLSAASLSELGGDHACGVDRSGGVACSGRNDFGQLGDGSRNDRDVPASVAGLAGAIQVAGGEWFTCARSTEGVRCWGRNAAGELGNGVGPDRDAPDARVALPTGVEAARIDAGEQHACALDTGGQLWCWGSNEFGQLGTPDAGDSGAVRVSSSSP